MLVGDTTPAGSKAMPPKAMPTLCVKLFSRGCCAGDRKRLDGGGCKLSTFAARWRKGGPLQSYRQGLLFSERVASGGGGGDCAPGPRPSLGGCNLSFQWPSVLDFLPTVIDVVDPLADVD